MPLAGPTGPGSGHYWSDGIGFSDWNSQTGSDLYRAGLAAGLSDIGGNLYRINGDGTRDLYGEHNGQVGFWVNNNSGTNTGHHYEMINGERTRVLNGEVNIGLEFVAQSSGGTTGSSGSENLGWIGVIAGVVEEGASNATPLIQRNLPAISDAGNVVGNWKITSKTGAQVLDYTKTGAKVVGYGAAGLAVVVDGVDAVNGDLSVQRFSYRTVFNAGAVTVGTLSSGGLGALVGGIGILSEKAYDSWVNTIEPAIRNAIPTGSALRFPIR